MWGMDVLSIRLLPVVCYVSFPGLFLTIFCKLGGLKDRKSVLVIVQGRSQGLQTLEAPWAAWRPGAWSCTWAFSFHMFLCLKLSSTLLWRQVLEYKWGSLKSRMPSSKELLTPLQLQTFTFWIKSYFLAPGARTYLFRMAPVKPFHCITNIFFSFQLVFSHASW